MFQWTWPPSLLCATLSQINSHANILDSFLNPLRQEKQILEYLIKPLHAKAELN